MASILNRITTIIRANINAALEQAEDPEVMLDQILREMYDGIKEAREQVVSAIAQQKLQERDLAQARELSEKWLGNARMAVDKGDEALARECLRRKRDYDENAEALEKMLAAQNPVINKLKSELSLLESKYTELRHNRASLLARYKAAKAQERMQETVGQAIGSISIYDPTGQLEQMERKIREKEAKVAARSELEREALDARVTKSLEAGSADLEIESQLLRLKAEAGQLQLGTGDSLEETGMPIP